MSKHHWKVPPRSLKDDIKRAVIRRDGLVCWVCRAPIASFEECTMDHIKKACNGGEFTEANLRPAHARCNHERHHRIMTPARTEDSENAESASSTRGAKT